MATSPGRDAGFCSGEDEDLDVDHADTDADNSPTDVSEDSVDVKVHAIGGITQKRKLATHADTNPKRTKQEDSKTRSPFRPWSHEAPRPNMGFHPHAPIFRVEGPLVPPPVPCGYTPPLCRPTAEQREPLSLVVKTRDRIYKPKYAGRLRASPGPVETEAISPTSESVPPLLRPPESLLGHVGYPMHLVPPLGQDRIPAWPPRAPQESISVAPTKSTPKANVIRTSGIVSEGVEPVPRCSLRPPSHGAVPEDRILGGSRGPKREPSSSHGPPKLRIKMEKRDEPEQVPDDLRRRTEEDSGFAVPDDLRRRIAAEEETSQFAVPEDLNPAYRGVKVKEEPEEEPREGRRKSSQQQRNYKNMTRERRMEANARERTRVHTISAAFETLRHAVPAYSHNQKLSKLSVLRIACSYIMTLSRIAGMDYSADQSEPSVASCVENVSRTIQMEGKLRKKKDEH